MNQSQAFGCVANTIKLRSGKYLDLRDPRPDQFDFADIAGGLSKICRFGGQCEWFYSVAEHSYRCAFVARDDGLSVECQRAALMHDAAEAFIGDIVKPLKIMLPEYANVEFLMEAAIAMKFDIDFEEHKAAVREIDHAMLIAERRAMFTADQVTWYGENQVRRLRVQFDKMSPPDAESMFVIRARELGIKVSSS